MESRIINLKSHSTDIATSHMGLISWVILAIVVLAIMGLGFSTFFSGVTKGAEKVGTNPLVKNATNEIVEYIDNATDNIKDKVFP